MPVTSFATPLRRLFRWNWCVRAGFGQGLVMGMAMLMLGLAAVPAAAAIAIQDDRQRQVVLDAPPQRVVSQLPSLTESVCALGACERLVGVDDFSNWPSAAVQPLPRLGGLEDTQIERVLALKPDLVLMSVASRAAGRLESLGVRVVALEPRSLDDVGRVLRQTGVELGLPPQRAEAVWAQVNAEVDQAAATTAGAKATRVYIEIGSGPYAAGPTSFIGGLLQRLGATNIVPADMGAYPRLNPEFVVRAQPQRIVVSARNARELARRPGWAALPALRDGQVCVLDDAQMDVLVRPGPRLGDAARLLADCLMGRFDGRAPVLLQGTAP
ncbi:MAG: Vitamin B12-binding protein [Paracidovorax wautersii]|uniref:Vitamin B12-binding protein n=1 Tax=Paracidovorax wautersii TaxID=1177982 RepID=A0A7V8FM59_9BURK|nr:MAG: Vitamin B12-binding protein [Paracidovorax wautersii]